VRAKLLLSVGLLLCGGGLVPTALQAASVPYLRNAASVKLVEIPASPVFFVGPKTQVQWQTHVATAQAVRPARRAETLLPVVDHEEIALDHRRIADEVLRLMPANCRTTLKNFYVRYDSPKQRGLAGKNTLILSGNVPEQEFRALLIHELGHVFDLSPDAACLGGTKESGTSTFRDGNDLMYADDPSVRFYRISWVNEKTTVPGSKPEDFVTGYATWDAYEDFAESFAYFVLHNDAFRERAQSSAALAAKYQWFQAELFPQGVSVATGEPYKKNSIPWDATKLAYTWHPRDVIAARNTY